MRIFADWYVVFNVAVCTSLLLFMNQSNLGVCLGALAWSCIITANLEKKIFYCVFVQRSKFNVQHIIFVL